MPKDPSSLPPPHPLPPGPGQGTEAFILRALFCGPRVRKDHSLVFVPLCSLQKSFHWSLVNGLVSFPVFLVQRLLCSHSLQLLRACPRLWVTGLCELPSSSRAGPSGTSRPSALPAQWVLGSRWRKMIWMSTVQIPSLDGAARPAPAEQESCHSAQSKAGGFGTGLPGGREGPGPRRRSGYT